MRILFTAAECAPFVKVGGLGDVIGALPKALEKIGIEVTVVIPGYQTIDLQNWNEGESFDILFSGETLKVTPYQTLLPGSGVKVIALKENKYISEGGVYSSKTAFATAQTEISRFAVFTESVVGWLKLQPKYDIVHAHEFHTGLVFHLLQDLKYSSGKIFTIHNLANQGISELVLDAQLGKHIGHDQALSWDSQDNNFDLMLQGIVNADWITVVSPSYATEITTPEFGEGLNEILKRREGRIVGILNGIDYDIWNPEKDHFLPQPYNSANYGNNRRQNKAEVLSKFFSSDNLNTPLFGFIGRLTDQKGLNLIFDSLKKIINQGKLVVLGRGSTEIEHKLSQLSAEFPTKIVYINTSDNFHEDYEHLMYGACDFMLVPSKFEPCGLVQMLAMHYGCIPIAHAVGGLKDSISNNVNGLLFTAFTKNAFDAAVDQAMSLYGTPALNQMIVNAMQTDFSWKLSAQKYLELYIKLLIPTS